MTSAAKESFQVLLSFGYEVKLYDEDGMNVAEPSDARRMFATHPNILLSIVDADDDSSVQLMFGKSTHARDIEGLMQALRTTATKYNMTFEPKKYGKEINPKDFRNLMSVAESIRTPKMQLCNGMYGTTQSSYLTLENAKMIIRHTDPVDPRKPDGRAESIGAIFVEDKAGQRLQFPSTDLTAARALIEHVNAGGSLDDRYSNMVLAEARDAVVKEQRRLRAMAWEPSLLAERNPIVREYLSWMDKFLPENALIDHKLGKQKQTDGDAKDGQCALGEAEELTREDVLLPPKNQGADLAREVTKAAVRNDPLNPDQQEEPSVSYVNRMKTLAGMNRQPV